MQWPEKWVRASGGIVNANIQPYMDQSLMQKAAELGLCDDAVGVGLHSGSMFGAEMNFGGNVQSNVGFVDMSGLQGVFSGGEGSRQSSDISGVTCDMASPGGSPSRPGIQPGGAGGNCLPQRLYEALLRIFPFCQHEAAMECFKELLQVLLIYFDVGPPGSQVDVNYFFKGENMVRGIYVPVKQGAVTVDAALVLQAVMKDGNLPRNQWTFRNQAVNGSFYMLTESSQPLVIPADKVIYIMVEEGSRAMSPAASLTEDIVGSAACNNVELQRNSGRQLNDCNPLLHIANMTGNYSGSQDGSGGPSGSQSPVGSFSDGASPDDFLASGEPGYSGSFGRSLHEVLGHSGEHEWLGGHSPDSRMVLPPAAAVQIPDQVDNGMHFTNSMVTNEARCTGSSPQHLSAGNIWMKPSAAVKPAVTTMANSGSAAPKEEWEKLNLFHKLCNLGQSAADVSLGVDISWVPWKLTGFREGQTKLHGPLRWKKKGKYWERDMTVKDDNRDRGKWSMHSASREWIHEVEPGKTQNIIKRYFKWMPKPEGGLLQDYSWILHEYVSVDATKKYSVYEEPEPGPNFSGLFVLTCTRASVKDGHSEGGRKLAGGGDDSGNGRHSKKKKHSTDHYGGGGENGGGGVSGFGGGCFGGGFHGGSQMMNMTKHKSMRMALEAVLASISTLSVSGEDIVEGLMMSSAKEQGSDMSAEENVEDGTWDSEDEDENEEVAESDVESVVGEGGPAIPSAPAPADGPVWAGAFGRGDKEDKMDGGGKGIKSNLTPEAMEELRQHRADQVVSQLQMQPGNSLLKVFMGDEDCEASLSNKLEATMGESSVPALEVQEFSQAELNTLVEGLKDKEEAVDEYFRTTKGTSGDSLLCVKELRVRCEDAMFMKVVKCQSLMNHQNLARIVGYCVAEDSNQALVYAADGSVSLHNKLHAAAGADANPLSWEDRLRIACGTASALNFFHNREPSLAHGDLSSKAILVDEKNGAQVMNSLVPGLVAVSGKDFQASDEFMNAIEYYQSVQGSEQSASRRTKESDIYAFGVILFELLTGRMPFDSTRGQLEMRLVEWAKSCVAADKVEKILDPAMVAVEGAMTSVKLSEARTLANIATRCTHRGRTERPAIGEILKTLTSLSTLAKN